MATTALGKKLSESILKDVSILLGRGKKAFQCPLTPRELVDMWEGMIRPDIVTAYKLLVREDIDGAQYLTSGHKQFDTFSRSGTRYTIKMRHTQSGQPPFLDVPLTANQNVSLRSYDQVKDAVPASKHSDFLEWVHNCATVQRDFEPALGTLEAVLGFCGTIGQLTRAVPDLHKYLDEDRQDLLAKQSRPSNMPYEWSAFDRRRVEQLQLVMAKANIMPRQGHVWGSIDDTGAIFAPDTSNSKQGD